MHWTDIVRRKLTLLNLGAWRVKTSWWGPHNRNLIKLYLGLSSTNHHQDLLLAQHPSIPTHWNVRPPFHYGSQQYAALNTELNTREGRGNIRNSFLSKKIHQVTTQRAQIWPPWFGSDMTNIPPPKFRATAQTSQTSNLTTREWRCKYQETINLN